MTMRITFARKLLMVAVLGVATATCSDLVVLPIGTLTTTRTVLTDDPFPYDRVARVDLYVVSVSASLSADTSAAAGGDFITLAAPHRKINLLGLQGGLTDELGTAS